MPTILLVHHSPTPSLEEVTRAVAEGVTHPDLEGGVDLLARPALHATVNDVGESDAVVLVTPVNFGYMSGALKHFFDSTFRDLTAAGTRRPYLAVVKGTTDADGAVRAIEAITTGLDWSPFRPTISIEGDVDEAFIERVRAASAEIAASCLM